MQGGKVDGDCGGQAVRCSGRGGQRGQGRCHPRQRGVDGVAHHLGEQLILGGEVEVEAAELQTGALGDPAQAGRGVAVLREF